MPTLGTAGPAGPVLLGQRDLHSARLPMADSAVCAPNGKFLCMSSYHEWILVPAATAALHHLKPGDFHHFAIDVYAPYNFRAASNTPHTQSAIVLLLPVPLYSLLMTSFTTVLHWHSVRTPQLLGSHYRVKLGLPDSIPSS